MNGLQLIIFDLMSLIKFSLARDRQKQAMLMMHNDARWTKNFRPNITSVEQRLRSFAVHFKIGYSIYAKYHFGMNEITKGSEILTGILRNKKLSSFIFFSNHSIKYICMWIPLMQRYSRHYCE